MQTLILCMSHVFQHFWAHQLEEETMCDHLGVSECSSKNKRAWHHSGLLVHEEESELWMPEELLIKLVG